jgi:hypothetical protein
MLVQPSKLLPRDWSNLIARRHRCNRDHEAESREISTTPPVVGRCAPREWIMTGPEYPLEGRQLMCTQSELFFRKRIPRVRRK